MLGTVDRLGRTLALFTPERPDWGVTEVALALDVAKTNAHEMLSSLVAIGLLERVPHGRYRLGWRLVAMSRNLVEADGLQRHARAVVDTVARRVGEAATVAAWDGRRTVCVATAGGVSAGDRPERAPGVRLPGHATALGKVLLAHRRWEEVRERASVDGLPALTAATVATIEALRRQLEAARERGVAVDRDEHHAGVSCVAAPVYDARSRVVAALSISMPSAKLRRAEPQYARAAEVAAQRLTSRLVAEQMTGEALSAARHG